MDKKIDNITNNNDDFMDVVILSAGSGRRFGGDIPKTFIKIRRRPILYYSIKAFNKLDFVKNIYIVVHNDYKYELEKIINKYLKPFTKIKSIIIGGKERTDSVMNALQYISGNNSRLIAIHDAARPFVIEDIIRDTYTSALSYGAAAPGINVVDTIKSIDEDMLISTHIDRKKLIAIQTPQIFLFDKLLSAYTTATACSQVYTDDTEIYSACGGGVVKITKGSEDLFKITFKNDLIKAKKVAQFY